VSFLKIKFVNEELIITLDSSEFKDIANEFINEHLEEFKNFCGVAG